MLISNCTELQAYRNPLNSNDYTRLWWKRTTPLCVHSRPSISYSSNISQIPIQHFEKMLGELALFEVDGWIKEWYIWYERWGRDIISGSAGTANRNSIWCRNEFIKVSNTGFLDVPQPQTGGRGVGWILLWGELAEGSCSTKGEDESALILGRMEWSGMGWIWKYDWRQIFATEKQTRRGVWDVIAGFRLLDDLDIIQKSHKGINLHSSA